MATVFRLVFNVPESHLAACKAAIFAAGAGRYPQSNYTECCFTSAGTSQFRPGNAARPHLGSVGQVEEVKSFRVETPCVGEDTVKKAIEALKKAHPYEEPAYQVYRVEDF
ncbi:GTP cyclohydrolase 1 type 2/Nif3 [Xylariales sp. PMI_506]|nr:GTP cyclohydrolase 1 type 2/Nif3 [Xylariales sp. PMI_506]